MIIFLIIIFVISAVLLILMILLQDDQGEGIGGLFGGGSSTAFGSRSGNILTRVTSILAIIFLATAMGVAWLNRSPVNEDIEARARIKSLEEQGESGWYMKSDESLETGSSTIDGADVNEDIDSSLTPSELVEPSVPLPAESNENE